MQQFHALALHAGRHRVIGARLHDAQGKGAGAGPRDADDGEVACKHVGEAVRRDDKPLQKQICPAQHFGGDFGVGDNFGEQGDGDAHRA